MLTTSSHLKVVNTNLRNTAKDPATRDVSELKVTAGLDSSSCSSSSVVKVMMMCDDKLQSIVVAHDVTSEVPLVTQDLSQKLLIGTRRHTIKAEPQTPQQHAGTPSRLSHKHHNIMCYVVIFYLNSLH